MGSFKRYLQSRGLSKGSIETILTKSYQFINWLEDQAIEPETASKGDVMGYLQHIRGRGIKQITVQYYIGCLKHYFAWQLKEGVRTDNPTGGIQIRGIKRKLLHEILSVQELEELYNSFQVPEKQPQKRKDGRFTGSILIAGRDKAMLSLLVYQGITTEEIQKLTVKDLKLREGEIYIPGGRKSSERTLELKPGQVLDLMEYTLQTRGELLALSGKQTDALFITTGGSNYMRGAIQKFTAKLVGQHPKLKNLKQIRASVITNWLSIYNLREVQYRAGHKYVSSTEAYKINQLEDLQADIEKFHPIG